MRRLVLALGLTAALFCFAGCKKRASDNDAIRAAILEHLAAIGTLNMSAMDMNVRSVSISGNQAHAEVEFRPKTGGAPGAGMQVAYNLEKRDGNWVVLKSQSLGGVIQHPDPRQNPHTNQAVHSGMPNFNEILNPSGAPAQGALPPDHPPANPQPSNPQPGAKDKVPAREL